MSSNTNFVQLKLALAATAAQTTITVMVPSAPFQLPAINGTLTLLDVPAAPTKAEIIGYTTVTVNGDGTATLDGVTRGKEGTTAQAWAANSFLFQSLTAADYAADLAAKQDSIAAGTAAQFWRGDKTWVDLGNTVRALALTGLDLTVGTAITATDTVLSALGKLQKQIADAATNLAGNVRSTALSGYLLGSNAALANTDTVEGAFGKVQAQLNAKLPLTGGTLTGHLKTSGYSIVSGNNANYNFGMLHDSGGMLNFSRLTKADVWSATLMQISDSGAVHASSFNGPLNGNASTATTLAGDQTNWANYRGNAVANMLGWKIYGNGHVIFDASAGTAPNGVAKNNTWPDVDWQPNFPTLMGWNGSSTFGVRVQRAAHADKCIDTGWISLSLVNGFTHQNNFPMQVRRVGNVVYLQGGVYRSTPPSGLMNFATIPAGYRPTKPFQFVATMNADNLNWTLADITGNVDGSINIGLQGIPNQNNAYWSFNTSWVTDYA